MTIYDFDQIDIIATSGEALKLVIVDPGNLVDEDRCYALNRKLQTYKIALESSDFRNENAGWEKAMIEINASAEPAEEMKNVAPLTFDVDGRTYGVPVSYTIAESRYSLGDDTKMHLVDVEYNYRNLCSKVVGLAREYISGGMFTPFGLSWNRQGETKTIDVSLSPSEQQLPAVKAALRQSISQDDNILAVAIGYDVLAIHPDQSEKTDAIAIDLEHRDGRPLRRIVHYKLVNGQVEMLSPYSTPKESELFDDSGNSAGQSQSEEIVEAEVVGSSATEKQAWLESLPTLCFVLIAGADGNIDRKEMMAYGKSLSKYSGHSNPLVRSVFSAALERLQADTVEILENAKSNAALLSLRLAVCKSTAVEMAPDHADEFFKVLLEVSTSVAAASGGFLGIGSKIGKEEKVVLNALERVLRGEG